MLALRFVAVETTEACMGTMRAYLGEDGRPVALYSDRHSVFQVTRKDGEGEPTQFTRALLTLDVEPIHASTPQAKGRVERSNRILQDRLVKVKEMRLRGIDGVGAANPCACLSSRRTTSGASRWRRGRRRTHTVRCCTTPTSWR